MKFITLYILTYSLHMLILFYIFGKQLINQIGRQYPQDLLQPFFRFSTFGSILQYAFKESQLL